MLFDIQSGFSILYVFVFLLAIGPAIFVSCTCFPFVVTILSILRQALGLQQSPPNIVIILLSVFITVFSMDPVFNTSWENGIKPFIEGKRGLYDSAEIAIMPFKEFANKHQCVQGIFGADPGQGRTSGAGSYGLSVFFNFQLCLLSEAFKVGFLIFLPFLIIDLSISAILMAIGMMMVPPAIVSLPFKIGFFVLVDGWDLIAGSLVSYFRS